MSGVSDNIESDNNSTIHNTYGHQKTYQRTFGRDTVEVVPMEHYYRNPDTLRTRLARPTLAQLHEQTIHTEQLQEQHRELKDTIAKEETAVDSNRTKFGWIEGVLGISSQKINFGIKKLLIWSLQSLPRSMS